METIPIDPWYLNWAFWAVVVSIAAVVLSQIPPLHRLLRTAKLDFEVHSRIHITHKVGNPNAQMHLIISNDGGRVVKINEILLHFSRGAEDEFILPAQNYLQSPVEKQTLLFTRITLRPGEEWAYLVSFLNFFSRNEEKQYRQMQSNLQTYIQDVLAKEGKREKPVEAPPEIVAPLVDFHNRKFKWYAGEYLLDVELKAVPERASLTKKYRITLFESDEKLLQDYVADYKFGDGIYYESKIHTGIIVPLAEA